MLISFCRLREWHWDVHCDKFQWVCCRAQIEVTSVLCVVAVLGTAAAATDGIVYVKGYAELEIISSHCVLHARQFRVTE